LRASGLYMLATRESKKGVSKVIGETRKEKRRFWIFFFVALVITVAGGKLWKLATYEVPQGLASDEFNKRCIANLDDLSVLVTDPQIAPYLVSQERIDAAFPESEASIWQYEHKDYNSVDVLLTLVENKTCVVSMTDQSLDVTKSALASTLVGRTKQIDLPPDRPGMVSYILFDESGAIRRALVIVGPTGHEDLEFGIALIKPENNRLPDGSSLDDYPIVKP